MIDEYYYCANKVKKNKICKHHKTKKNAYLTSTRQESKKKKQHIHIIQHQDYKTNIHFIHSFIYPYVCLLFSSKKKKKIIKITNTPSFI